MKRAAQPYTPI